jgi:hypothetical protein
VPATVSFEITWSRPTATRQVVDAKQRFAGTFLDVITATAFSAQTGDFVFVSDPITSAKSEFGLLGYETNGVFFPAPGTPAP